MTYLAFDNETQIHKRYKRTANPFIPENYIVARGWRVEGDTMNSYSYHTSKAEVKVISIPDNVTILYGFNIKFDLLYEMCVPGGYEVIMAFINRGGKIWDGQYAKYLVSGQQEKYQMCSMDDIILEYGGRKKIDGMKELWSAGVQTSDIDKDMVLDYLIGTEEEHRLSGDIGNTVLICEGTIAEAKQLGMFHAIERRMDGLLATTEMEYRGLKIDRARAAIDLKLRMAELAEVNARLDEYIKFIPEEVKFNWGSGVHSSCLFFGGTIRYQKQAGYLDDNTGLPARLKATARWPLFKDRAIDPALLPDRGFVLQDDGSWVHPRMDQDRFKSGKQKGAGKFKTVDVPGALKVKYQDFFFECPRITEPDPDWLGALTDGMNGPVWSTSADVIVELSVRDIPFLKDFGRYSKIMKELGTYYVRYDEKKKEHVGMLTCVNPEDDIVHHSLNHTLTVTTRLSSSSPNMQNLPTAIGKDGSTSNVKAMFVSRFTKAYCERYGFPFAGDDENTGQMVELDYSQLEVVIQGLMSGDKNLVADLIAKIDFHCKRVSKKFGCTYEEALYWCKSDEYKASNPVDFAEWKNRRKGVKEFSFQRAYGAGAAGIADATGLDIEDVKKMIEVEDAMYPGVLAFNEKVEREVNHTAVPFSDPQRGFRQFRRGQYKAPTGTLYTFRSWDAPAFIKKKGITDTFKPPELKNYPIQGTGGEVVQLVLGLLLRMFYKCNNWGGKAFLVNTVHDCVWIDTHKDVTKEVAEKAKMLMENIPAYLKHFYNINCPVPFPAEAEAGPNMLDLDHIH